MSTCFVFPTFLSVLSRSRGIAFRMLAPEALRERNDKAEQIIIQLKNKINLIKQAAAANVSKVEEERLKEENDALRKEIAAVRMQLTYAEIRNGAKMFPIPRKSTESVALSAASTDENTAPPLEKTKASGKQPSPPGTSEGKPKKEAKGKPPKDGEAKPKKGAAAEAGAGGEERMDVSRLDFRIGRIMDVVKHPDADSLYVEQVDLGEGQNRTIVSGLVNHIPIEQMQGRLAMFMCNLKAAKMRGILSQGMIMCANKDGKVEILNVPSDVQPGDKVTVDAYPGTPDAQLNPKKKIWESLKPDIRVNGEKVACYKDAPFKVEGKGVVTAPSITDAQIQ